MAENMQWKSFRAPEVECNAVNREKIDKKWMSYSSVKVCVIGQNLPMLVLHGDALSEIVQLLFELELSVILVHPFSPVRSSTILDHVGCS